MGKRELIDPHSQEPIAQKRLKHILERKRRERINNSIYRLRDIIIDHISNNVTIKHKLEKADILEETVKLIAYLISIRKYYLDKSNSVDCLYSRALYKIQNRNCSCTSWKNCLDISYSNSVDSCHSQFLNDDYWTTNDENLSYERWSRVANIANNNDLWRPWMKSDIV